MQITPPRRKIGYPSEELSPVKGISRAVKELVHYQFVSVIRVILVDGSPQMQAYIKEKDQGSQEVCSRGKWAAEEGRAQTSSYTCNQVDTSAADGGPKDSADDTTQPKGEAQPVS